MPGKAFDQTLGADPGFSAAYKELENDPEVGALEIAARLRSFGMEVTGVRRRPGLFFSYRPSRRQASTSSPSITGSDNHPGSNSSAATPVTT